MQQTLPVWANNWVTETSVHTLNNKARSYEIICVYILKKWKCNIKNDNKGMPNYYEGICTTTVLGLGDYMG